MRNLIVLSLCFLGSYARLSVSETPRKRKLQVKELPSIYLNEKVGASVTLNCPVTPAVARMYRYLSRVKSGKELEYARRQLSRLIGVKYKWYKDGKAIRHHRSAFLMNLQTVQIEDAGSYTCKVLTPKEGRSRNFVLKVFELSKRGLPILESESENITLRASESMTLRCVSTNTRHRPQIKWLKRNESNELAREGYLELTQNDTKTPSGFGKEYELIDPKHNGIASTSVRARVRHCKKEKSYEFRLMLENVQEKDSGMYVCLVQNKHGSDYRRFFVQVKSMKGVAPYPTHEELRRNFMVFPAYTTAKLRCYVTGDKPLIYQWYKNGKRFLRRRLERKVNSTTSVLRIRNLVPSDSGVYMCRVTNPHGVFEHNITMKVLPRIKSAPILLTGYPKNVTSSPGKTVMFQCIESISDPMPDYRWYKWHTVPAGYPKLDVDDTSLYTEIDPIHYTSMKVKMGNSFRYGGRVTLKNITEDDVGLYSCVRRNQLGMDYASAFLRWKSEEGPKFVSSGNRPTLIEVPSAEPLKLDCNATGDPQPNITWYRNGKPLTRMGGVVLSNYTLTLHELLPEHSGNYSCHIRNKLGSINHSFTVRIKEWLFSRPIILPAAKKVLRSGQRYELKCIIVSHEPPTTRLTRELGTKVNGSETLTRKGRPVKLDENIYQRNYVIKKATINDSGIYQCVARNTIGVSQRKFQIQVVA